MAIGRISGPMLVPNLERQGIDLAVDGDLIYFDVGRRRVGINTFTPTTELDVVGNAKISANLTVGTGPEDTISVGTKYSLPTTIPGYGQVITSMGGGDLATYWAPGLPDSAIRRHKYETTINNLLGFGTSEFKLNLGVSAIVYSVGVSRPVKVEVFGTAAKDEDNPYTFIATPDHLVDDGTVILNDGSSFQSRQYSIFTNMETPPDSNVYVTLTSLSPYLASTPITFSVYYFPAVTDSRPGTEILQSLPTTGNYNGRTVFVVPTTKLHVFVNNAWVSAV